MIFNNIKKYLAVLSTLLLVFGNTSVCSDNNNIALEVNNILQQNRKCFENLRNSYYNKMDEIDINQKLTAASTFFNEIEKINLSILELKNKCKNINPEITNKIDELIDTNILRINVLK